jgi:hypothetical protein
MLTPGARHSLDTQPIPVGTLQVQPCITVNPPQSANPANPPKLTKMDQNACTESNLAYLRTPPTHHKPHIPNSGRVETETSLYCYSTQTCTIHTPTSNMPPAHTHSMHVHTIQSSEQERTMQNNEDESNGTRNHKCHRNLTILAISRRRRLQNNVY